MAWCEKMTKMERFLNGDILFEVLSRIPAKLLLGMKCISREWHALISSRSFVKAQMQSTGLVLTGFIFQEKFMFCNQDIKAVGYIPVETRGARVHNALFAFLPQEVVILASCKGLVCCRSCFPSPDPALYICNPSTKDWIRLDCPSSCHRSESIAMVFDDNDALKGFKLVRVKQVGAGEEDLYLTFELYSSEARAWRKSNEICQCDTNLIKNKGVYIGGVLHWLTDGDQVLSFDVDKELSWLISVPVPAVEFRTVPEASIGDSDGKLHYVLISEQGLHVWCLEDYYEFKWTLKHCKSLEEIEGEFPHFFFNLKNRVLQRVNMDTSPWMNPLGFKDGILLLKVCANLYLYDINNNKMTHACSLQDLNSKSMPFPTVFPHSLSLVPLNHA